MSEELKDEKEYPSYLPDEEELQAIKEVLTTMEKGRGLLSKSFDYFNGRSLLEAIDDWTKRWNGYIPPQNQLLNDTQSQIFINFTRNAIISYLAKVAMSPIRATIVAVNKKLGLPNRQVANVLKDLNQYSLNAESGEARFLEAALECVTKGTVVVYEGYMRTVQKDKIVKEFDAEKGKLKYIEGERVIFDNCYQQVVPLEDFYISNAFEPNIQKQPKVIWRKITTHFEAEQEFGGYKNWKFVRPGAYVSLNVETTFYREDLGSHLGKDEVEVFRYYNRKDNRHVIMVNGVILYDDPIPFKDGKYPFAKTVNEPFAVDFFWGNGHPGKYMGEQDLINTFINLMADKTINSLLPTGLSSDLDDMVDDDVIEIGKIRKVSDIEKWKWWEAPEVNGGEQQMFQQIMNLAREAGNTDAGMQSTPKGGKVPARQLLLKQQEIMQKISFNMNFLEDLERDRTELRISHILQFYSIPKVEKITGKNGKEVEKLLYRDVHLSQAKLSDGRTGTKMLKLINSSDISTPDDKQKLADQLSVMEVAGEEMGQPTEALAIAIDTFSDYNYEVQVVKNSSFEKNQALDQASKLEFANWRLGLAPVAPLDIPELIKWVEESFDVDPEQFELQKGGAPQVPGMNQPQQQPQPGQQPLKQMAPSRMGAGALNSGMGQWKTR